MEVPPRRHPRSANDEALRFARSCYDHLAGQIGVAVTDALVAMVHIVLTDEGGEVTSSGGHFLAAVGADLRPRTRRIFCQPWLDWSERRYLFFFQAEDGIRDLTVTGVQTCALPI